MRKILWPIGAQLAPGILWILERLGRDHLASAGTFIGSVWYLLSIPDQRLGRDNLDYCFGNTLSEEQKEEICRESFKNIIKCMLDFFYFSFRPQKAWEHIRIEKQTKERLDKIMHGHRAALILTAHLGNWELLSGYLQRHYKDMEFIAHNQGEYDRFTVDCRMRYKVGTIQDDSTDSATIVRKLETGKLIGFVFDRNLSHSKGIIASFFNKPVYSPYFPVNLARYSGAPVIGMFLVQEGRDYQLVVDEPIYVHSEKTSRETYQRYVQIFLDITEKYIRQYPSQWFWGNKRWHRPKGDLMPLDGSRDIDSVGKYMLGVCESWDYPEN